MNHYKITQPDQTIYIQETTTGIKIVHKYKDRYQVENETDELRRRMWVSMGTPIKEGEFSDHLKKSVDWSVDQLKFGTLAKGEPIAGHLTSENTN